MSGSVFLNSRRNSSVRVYGLISVLPKHVSIGTESFRMPRSLRGAFTDSNASSESLIARMKQRQGSCRLEGSHLRLI